jgi:hypothetical protein
MKKLLILLFILGCTSPAKLSEKSIHEALYYKVAILNSYGGALQNTMNILEIKSLGEFPISRISRIHRRYDFSVKIKFNQDCYQLGSTCLKYQTYATVNNPRFYVKRSKGEIIQRIYFISFLKTKTGWKVMDENLKWPPAKTLSMK